MQPDESDSNHPSPGDPSGDVWEDAGNFSENPQAHGTVLPPKKPPLEDASSPHAAPHLEINDILVVQTKRSDDNNSSLDVRKIEGDVLRLKPEEPTQPKMPRHWVFQEQPAQKERDIDDASWGRETKFSTKWILMIGAGVTTILISTFLLLNLITRSKQSNSKNNHLTLTAEPWKNPEASGNFEELAGCAEEAAQIYRKFKTTASVDEFLPSVRDGKTLESIIRKNHEAELLSNNWNPGKNARWEIYKPKHLSFGILSGVLPDYSEFEAYFVLENHQLLIDWKASTAYSTATFEQLSKNQGDPSEIRTRILPADYYTPAFPEKTYQSFKIIAADHIQVVWCYTRRGDLPNDQLYKIFYAGAILEPPKTPHKVTLRLERGPKDSAPNQYLISALLHEEWINP